MHDRARTHAYPHARVRRHNPNFSLRPLSSILAVTVFFIVIAGVLRPLMILTSDVLTLNVLLFLASAGFIAINFLKIIDYEYLFFISAVLKFVCVAGSVLKRES